MKRNRAGQTSTSKRAYSDALRSMGVNEQKFIKAARAAGLNGIHYEEAMEITGLSLQSSATVRCNLLERGFLNFNGKERPTIKGKAAAIVVHKKFSTAEDIERTTPWRAERLKKKAAEAALEAFPKLEAQRIDARKAGRRLMRISEFILDPTTSGKQRRKAVNKLYELGEWLDTEMRKK